MALPLETIIIGVLRNPNAQCQPGRVAVVHHAPGCEANTLMEMKEFSSTLMVYNRLSPME